MPALPSEEAKDFHRLIAQVGEQVIRDRIAPRTSISQLSFAERQELMLWLTKKADARSVP
jgi:hypothetical protein